MLLLAFAVALFAAIHLVAAAPSLKAGLAERFGAAWRPLYVGASIAALALIVVAWRNADVWPVYEPPEWGHYATFTLVLLAFLCLGIFLFRGRLRQVLVLPLSIGVVLWGTGHLFSNGDLAGIILFGGFIFYGLAHLAIGLAAGYRPTPVVRQGHDALSIFAGVALYGMMAQAHGALIGIPVVTLTH
ncbi:MAG: NnrU family protein [Hyphomicrobiales bacterium]